jgi:hypothetical protein
LTIVEIEELGGGFSRRRLLHCRSARNLHTLEALLCFRLRPSCRHGLWLWVRALMISLMLNSDAQVRELTGNKIWLRSK